MPGAVLRFEQHLILFYFYTVTFNDMWAFSAQGWIANVKRTFLALVVFCAVLAPLIHLVRQQVPIYEARSLISFALGREYVYVPEPSLSDIKAPNAGDFQGFVNAEILLLDNPRLIESAVDKVGFERTYPDLPFTDAGRRAATVALDAATKVELITGSYVVKIAVRHTDPEIAAELANALTDSFLEQRRSMYLGREVETVTERLESTRLEADRIDARLAQLLGGSDPVVIEERLKSATREQAQLTEALRDARLDLLSLRQQRSALQDRLVSDAEWRQADLAVSEAEARVAFFKQEKTTVEAAIGEMSTIMPRVRLLKASQDAQTERLAELELRLRDTKAVSSFDNVRVIETGVPPLRPVSMPPKTQFAIAGAVAGLAAFAAVIIATLLAPKQPEPRPRRMRSDPGLMVLRNTRRANERAGA